MRKIQMFCAACKKEILYGEEIVFQSDRRGTVHSMYHRKCVIVHEAPKEKLTEIN